jgi:hypothetical protein
MKIRLASLLLILWAAFHPVTASAQANPEDDRPSVAVVLGGGGGHAIV